MRHPGETDTNDTSVVTRRFNIYQMILDVEEASGYGDVYSISQPFRFESAFVDALSFGILSRTTRQSADGTLFGFSRRMYKMRGLPRLPRLVPP